MNLTYPSSLFSETFSMALAETWDHLALRLHRKMAFAASGACLTIKLSNRFAPLCWRRGALLNAPFDFVEFCRRHDDETFSSRIWNRMKFVLSFSQPSSRNRNAMLGIDRPFKGAGIDDGMRCGHVLGEEQNGIKNHFTPLRPTLSHVCNKTSIKKEERT